MKIVSKQEYSRRVERASPPSPVGKDCLLAFLFGGAVCTLGQGLCSFYQSLGLELSQARTGVSISLIFLSALLTALGGRAEEGPDFLTVHGGTLTGGMVDCANDHRIAMAAAIAATACTGPVTVLGAQCVQKSYPDFWEVYKNLGGDIHVL